MSNEYCTKSNMVDIYNLLNINRWADAEGDADTIAARVARAIDVASDEIDDEMRNSPYMIPVITPGGDTPTAITDIAAKLAGVWLYEGKGTEDSKGTHRLTSVKGEAHLALANIRTGKRQLDAL